MTHGKANRLTVLIIIGLVAGAVFGQLSLHVPQPAVSVTDWLRGQCPGTPDAACLGDALDRILPADAETDGSAGAIAVAEATAALRGIAPPGEIAARALAGEASAEESAALKAAYAAWRRHYVGEVNPGIGTDHWTKTIGDIVLIRPLMLMIIPLVLVSVVCGVCSIGDPSRLGIIGGTTVTYYLATMLMAVVLGATLVTLIEPGVLSDPAQAEALRADAASQLEGDQTISQRARAAEGTGLGGAWLNIIDQMLPKNAVAAMGQGQTLGVIVIALLLGLALASGGEATAPARAFFDAMFDAIMRIVGWIIWLTPIGVFMLVAWTVGRIGLDAVIGPLARYIGTVLIGLAIHGLLVLPLVLWIFARTRPYRYLWQMRRPLFTAFGIDSSSATLPVTIDAAINEGGCSKRSANFVLPLGATVNMDGTALYEAVAVVFLFQLYGIDLSMTELLVVVVTATLAAIGAAGIPSAGVVTMVIVITAVNASLGGEPRLPLEAIGIILGVDRIVDMCRTTVNVWGDAVGAKIITRIAPDTEEHYEAAAG
jgi:Na+/H+-dicarboxylate symporter